MPKGGKASSLLDKQLVAMCGSEKLHVEGILKGCGGGANMGRSEVTSGGWRKKTWPDT